MTRNLARLRFKPPRPIRPLNLARVPADQPAALENRIRNHVIAQSKPTKALSLQIVVHPKWKQKPGKANQPLHSRPHTVRDLVDPEGVAQHGQIIYVFSNIRTGQVIYSLSELLDQHHLEQLPFIGKHSKPPVIRPDEWTPHCVVTFAVPEQGLQAFRRLREYRHLHETAWNKTNPEWLGLPAKKRMQKIMNQVPNTSADLAAVLRTQEAMAEDMQTMAESQEVLDREHLEKLWDRIHTQAEASLAKDRKDSDDPKKLEQIIKKHDAQLKMKHNQNEEDQARLKLLKKNAESRLRMVQWAQKKSEELKNMQATLYALAAPAMEAGAEDQLAQLKQEVDEFDGTSDPKHAQAQRAKLAELEAAFEAKRQADEQDHDVKRSVLLPFYKNSKGRIHVKGTGKARAYKGTLPRPFTMDVEIKWADLRNAEYAAGQWPEAVVHDTLPLKQFRQEVQFVSAEQYEQIVQDEVNGMIKDIERQAVGAESVWEEEAAEPEKTGIMQYIPNIKNPFKRAEA